MAAARAIDAVRAALALVVLGTAVPTAARAQVAAFLAVVMGDATQSLLLTSSAGYGFIATLADLEAG